MYRDPLPSGDDQGVRVLRLSRRGLPGVRFISNLRRFRAALQDFHAQHPIDIIEAAETDLYLMSISFPSRKVLRMHGGPTFFGYGGRIQAWKERRSFAVADSLCAVSKCVAEGTRQVLGLGDAPIEVIPNPVNITEFAPDDSSVEDGLIVFAGTVARRKGIVELIRAMPLILQKVPHAHLEIYGGEAIDPPPAYPLAVELQAAMAPEVSRRVEWKGRVPRDVLPRALQRANVCVYPSYIEAMPIAWIEGMAAGKAVVASRTGPGPEIIDDGVTGLLCDPYNPASIAEQIVRVLTNPDLSRQLGRAARSVAVAKWSLPQIVDRNIEYYSSLIDARITANASALRP